MENISRREFNKFSFMGLVSMVFLSGLSLVTTGCAVAADIANWVPVGINAFQSLLTLLDGLVTPPLQILFQAIIAAMNALVSVAKQYDAITPPPTGALANLKAALQLVITNFQSFLQGINFGSNTSLISLVTGLAEMILATISGFEAALPASVAKAYGASVVPKEFRAGSVQISGISPRPRHKLTRRSFIHDWNALATAGGHKESKLPESLVQHL
jgi:hypothetical protein